MRFQSRLGACGFPPNAEAQLDVPTGQLCVTERLQAGRVRCSAWLGDGYMPRTDTHSNSANCSRSQDADSAANPAISRLFDVSDNRSNSAMIRSHVGRRMPSDKRRAGTRSNRCPTTRPCRGSGGSDSSATLIRLGPSPRNAAAMASNHPARWSGETRRSIIFPRPSPQPRREAPATRRPVSGSTPFWPESSDSRR